MMINISELCEFLLRAIRLFFPPRQFLFKPGGTSPMYCTTSPGYPLTSSTVYSPPPRPLPRNTFSRPAFSLKKPYKHCNWKCAALSAILISVTLLFLLAYFIGESPLTVPLMPMRVDPSILISLFFFLVGWFHHLGYHCPC